MAHPGDATIANETDFASDGSQGLRIETSNSNGDWFVVTPSGGSIDLFGRTALSFDVSNPSASFARAIFLKTGANEDICQGGGFVQQPSGVTPVTVTVTFTSLQCMTGTLDLGDVRQLGIWLNGGPIDIDHVRAQ